MREGEGEVNFEIRRRTIPTVHPTAYQSRWTWQSRPLKDFDATNLRHMRGFYLAFPIRDAVRRELSWTHYRNLLRVENEAARQWYMNEAATQNWSSRALDRQIGTLYYERLLLSEEKGAVVVEADAHIQSP